MYSFVPGKTGSFELNAEEWEALHAFRRGEPDLPSPRSAVRRLVIEALVRRNLLRVDGPRPPKPRSGVAIPVLKRAPGRLR